LRQALRVALGGTRTPCSAVSKEGLPTGGPYRGGPTAAASALAQRDAVELLRAVGEGVGLLRVRGDWLEATSLRHAWAQIDRGLVYAAWCQQVTLTG
jgi:hypothetical protein